MVHAPASVHAERSDAAPSPSDPRRDPAPRPARYVLIPDGLILAFAHDPLAVGVYAAIARLTLAARGAAPIAARDLASWMGSDRNADRAAIMRRIVKLAASGWLIVQRGAATKHRLLPTWGYAGGARPQPWCFRQPALGRPLHARSRRVPLVLFDTYLGRLDLRTGQHRALVSRYLSRPLLDLTDVGVYTIGLRAEIAPTVRLQHHGLAFDRGVLPPPDSQSLLERAARGELTTLDQGECVVVHLSIQGHAALLSLGDAAAGTAPEELPLPVESEGGSTTGSSHGSLPGSAAAPGDDPLPPQQLAKNAGPNAPPALIAWEEGYSHGSPMNESTPMRSGGELPDLTGSPARTSVPRAAHAFAQSVAPLVAAGHTALNPNRDIQAGEWIELLELQQRYGVGQLLVWQARAQRASIARQYGITPGYYRSCAAQRQASLCQSKQESKDCSETPAHVTEHQPQADPACAALLQKIGIRALDQLTHVPLALIQSWQGALDHPGMAARFTAPLGFAVNQLRLGNPPPLAAELDAWAAQAQRRSDQYETWRFVPASSVASESTMHESQLETRVRALAPPDATLAELCALADALEAGVLEQEALGQLLERRGGVPL